jgi:hypothetical protein
MIIPGKGLEKLELPLTNHGDYDRSKEVGFACIKLGNPINIPM